MHRLVFPAQSWPLKTILIALGLACVACNPLQAPSQQSGFEPSGQRTLATKDCGLGIPNAPSFNLEDHNPSSNHFGQQIQLSDFADQVAVIYFAHAT